MKLNYLRSRIGTRFLPLFTKRVLQWSIIVISISSLHCLSIVMAGVWIIIIIKAKFSLDYVPVPRALFWYGWKWAVNGVNRVYILIDLKGSLFSFFNSTILIKLNLRLYFVKLSKRNIEYFEVFDVRLLRWL